jgi:hypothetical protein
MSVMLCGCAATPQYKAPISGPTAELSVDLNNKIGNVFVRISTPTTGATEEALTSRSAPNGWGLSDPTNRGNFVIPANEKISIVYDEDDFISTSLNYDCESFVTFVPAPGVSYVFTGGESIFPPKHSGVGDALLSVVTGPVNVMGSCAVGINPSPPGTYAQENELRLDTGS